MCYEAVWRDIRGRKETSMVVGGRSRLLAPTTLVGLRCRKCRP